MFRPDSFLLMMTSSHSFNISFPDFDEEYPASWSCLKPIPLFIDFKHSCLTSSSVKDVDSESCCLFIVVIIFKFSFNVYYQDIIHPPDSDSFSSMVYPSASNSSLIISITSVSTSKKKRPPSTRQYFLSSSITSSLFFPTLFF